MSKDQALESIYTVEDFIARQKMDSEQQRLVMRTLYYCALIVSKIDEL